MNNIVKTALLLAVVLSVTAFAVGTLSEDSDAVSNTYSGDGYTLAYTLENNEITITGFYPGSDFDGSVILDKIEGYSVVAIEDHVFQTTKLKSIVLPDTLRTIGEQAFGGSGLTQLVVPNSVTSIGRAAFSFCQDLELLIIGEKVSTLSLAFLDNRNPYDVNLIYLSSTDDQDISNNLRDVYTDNPSLAHFKQVPDWAKESDPLYSFTYDDTEMTFSLDSDVASLISTYGGEITYEWTRTGGSVDNATGTLTSGSSSTTLEFDITDLYTITVTIDLKDGQKLSFTETHNTDENKSMVWFMNGSTTHDYAMVDDGETVQEIAGPSVGGLNFIGWYEENADQPFNFETPINNDLSLHAKFEVAPFEVDIVAYNSATASGFQADVTEHGQISYTYSWTVDGVEQDKANLLLRPDISLQYTLTVTATYDGDMEKATTKTVPVLTDAPVDSLGGEVRVFFGPAIGSMNDFRFSGTDSTIYLPEGSYEVWYHQEGYTCPHEKITVTEGATNSVELEVEEAPEVDPAPEPEPEEPGIDVPPWAWDDDDDYVPPIVPSQTDDSGDDDTTTVVACAAAAVVAALMTAFLILDRRH